MGQRTWTDDQLRDAVASQKSWRGVLRALDVRGGSSIRVVQKHAERLGLNTDHFSGPRRWSDEDLVKAIQDTESWKEVSRQLGLADDRRTAIRLKGHAMRLGVDTSHLDDRPKGRQPDDTIAIAPRLSELRNAAPSIAAAWFSLRGWPVAFPSEPQEYDLLVTTPDGIKRVQVKSTTFRASNGNWQVCIGHRPYTLDKSAAKDPYDPSDLDYFVIVNGVGEIYLIPIRVVAGRTGIYLSAYEEYKVGNVAGLLNC